MQWAFTPATQGALPLKRKASNPNLLASPPMAKRAVAAAAAAAPQPGGSSSAAAAPLAAEGPAGVDVEAVARKHGWDLQQRNDWSGDRQVMWLPVAAIRRPLQGARSNGERGGGCWVATVEGGGLRRVRGVVEREPRKQEIIRAVPIELATATQLPAAWGCKRPALCHPA